MRHFRRMASFVTAGLLIIGQVCAKVSASESFHSTEYLLEGPGYASAEEAMEAYVNCQIADDPQGMARTFAFETYVDHMDHTALYNQVRNVNLQTFSTYGFPSDDEYIQSVSALARYSSIVRSFVNQTAYFGFRGNGTFSDIADGEPIIHFEEDTAEKLTSYMQSDEFINPLSDGVLLYIGSPENVLDFFPNSDRLREFYYSENNQNKLEEMRMRYGADELAERVALLQANYRGMNTIMFQSMQSARYEDKWYNISLESNFFTMMGLRSLAGGLWILGEDDR